MPRRNNDNNPIIINNTNNFRLNIGYTEINFETRTEQRHINSLGNYLFPMIHPIFSSIIDGDLADDRILRQEVERIRQQEAAQRFQWDRFMENSSQRVETFEEGAYSAILIQALEAGVISQKEIDNIDSRYICGITQQIMDAPVYDVMNSGKSHGGRFDRRAIETWIKHKHTNPETRREIPPVENFERTFTEDIELKKEIEEFMQGIMTRMTLDRPRP